MPQPSNHHLGQRDKPCAVNVRPGPRVIGAFQHFAAGVVFAAAAGELLPELMVHESSLPILIGGGLGIVATYAIKAIESYYGEASSFILSVLIDTLVDGLIIGMGFVAGAAQGFLLTFALSVEVLFLGLALTSSLSARFSAAAIIALSVVIGAMLPAGAWLGLMVAGLPPAVITAGYAFGLIALLYLVTEELLVEAHTRPDTPAITALFFVGFMLVVLMEHHIRFAGAG
ncbi:MAG: transporter [Alphaproteobacteria bacterium]|nr:transporter [Alphaproteobacteria bacterium]